MRLELVATRERRRALVAYYGWRLGAAWLLTTPVAAVLEGTRIGHLPNGDGAAFEPSGLYLVEMLRLAEPALRASVRNSQWTAIVLCVLGLIPLAWLLEALSATS